MRWGWALTLAGVAIGCGAEPRTSAEIPRESGCEGQTLGVTCEGEWALECAGEKLVAQRSCAALGLACVEGAGCRACEPRAVSCAGQQRSRCNPDGTALELVESCAEGAVCTPGGCKELCAEARAERSYLGCDYWPVLTSNRALDDRFLPALSIGNGQSVVAHVQIRKGTHLVAEADVAPGSAKTVQLAYDPELKNALGSTLQRQAAYHLTSSVPVTVHQFNPLLFELPGECADPQKDANAQDDKCFSFTNDASLLLPSSVLGPLEAPASNGTVNFLVAARASFMVDHGNGYGGGPGFVAVVAVGERPVRVSVKTRSHTRPSLPLGGPDAIEPLVPGQLLERTLAPGDVLQLLSEQPEACPGAEAPTLRGRACDPGPEYDLTGTEVSADGPIQVISGHDCTNVPFDRYACDHLEESLLPLAAWGKRAIVTSPHASATRRYRLRVISGDERNLVSFDPPIVAPVMLARGQWYELETSEAVQVRGAGRLMVAQYLLGQSDSGQVGDPSLSISVPVEQYRSTYYFVSPETYSSNYVDIVAQTGDVVTLDGQLVSGFLPLGDTGFAITTVELRRAGSHELRGHATVGLGITLYGRAPYTSYMLPGGLDVRPLEIPVF